ncbi:hypothetical protein B4077_0978 [Bacillus cereus]|jgi:hypothetical protein|uniref:Uncharacterized protein n=1 Tax=Bacillus cereus TaxID=1396 RepID=A0A0G8F910_BACCE|nr:hypothetical protein bcere0006_8610 [Bacillus wiedmannii]KLA32222.1 hypothetical protein B4077_0978 [Bacillus cereus]
MFQRTNQKLIQQTLYNTRMESRGADGILKYKELLDQSEEKVIVRYYIDETLK